MVITDRQVPPNLERPIMLVLTLVCSIERIQNTGQSKESTWKINREKGSSVFNFSILRGTYAPFPASRS